MDYHYANFIEFIIMLTAVITVIVAIYSLRTSIKQNNDQMRLSFFTDYTKRYQEIMLGFPFDIGNPDFDIHALDDKQKDMVLKYMRAYYDLCSEEYYQFQKKNIDKATWVEWEEGIKDSLSKKAFRDAWDILCFNSKYYEDFTNLMKKIYPNSDKPQHSNNNRSKSRKYT